MRRAGRQIDSDGDRLCVPVAERPDAARELGRLRLDDDSFTAFGSGDYFKMSHCGGNCGQTCCSSLAGWASQSLCGSQGMGGWGMGDTDRSLFLPPKAILTWRGEIDPGWWLPGSEQTQDQTLRAIGDAVMNQASGFFSFVHTKALSVHRSSVLGTTLQWIIDAEIDVSIQTRVQVQYAEQFIKSGIVAAGARIVPGTVNLDVAQNPYQAENPNWPVSETGPPAVSPDNWYDPHYSYGADYVPDFQWPSLSDLTGKLKFDPTSGISLVTIALIVGGAIFASRLLAR